MKLICCIATALTLLPCFAASASSQSNALRIVVIAGEDAVNVIQQKTAVAPIVEVRDRNNLPVAGASVVFTLNGSGATFAGARTLTVVTNAAGQATAAGLTPTTAGAINISATATFQGQTATIAIAQSNVLTAAEAAKLANTGTAASGGGGGLSAGKLIAIVGGVGAAGAGVAVAAGGSGGDSSTSTTSSSTTATSTTGSNTTAPTSGTPTTTTPTTPTPTPVANSAPVINAATVTPAVGLVGTTQVAFDVQATDPDNNALTYLWEFPDGSTSDQRAFSRVFNLGGTHNSRITVRDGRDSTSREFSFEMKTVSGDWDDQVHKGKIFSFSQNGSSISGTMRWDILGVNCPLTGTLRSSAPQLILEIPPCSRAITHNGQQIATTTQEFRLELALDAAMSGLSGTENERFTNVSMHGVVQRFEYTRAVQLRKR
jgi:hypothetical protein